MKTRIAVVTFIASTAGVAIGSAQAESRATFETSSRHARVTSSNTRAQFQPGTHRDDDASAGPVATVRSADEVSGSAGSEGDYPAATRALEITVATGYAQAFGKVGNGHPQLNDIGQAGAALQLGIGYRVLPQLTLGVYGSGAAFSRGDLSDSSTNMYAATAGVQADWHFLPSGERFDPWVGIGTGWRGYWIHSDATVPGAQAAGTSSLQGLQLAKLQLGVDYRIAPAVAISPVIGADLSMFLVESPAGGSSYRNVDNPQVNTFVFAGLLGRFDISTGSPASSGVAQR